MPVPPAIYLGSANDNTFKLYKEFRRMKYETPEDKDDENSNVEKTG